MSLKHIIDIIEREIKEDILAQVLAIITVIFIIFQICKLFKQQQQIRRNIQINKQIQTNMLFKFRDFFNTSIKPTFVNFYQEYPINQDLQKKFRLSKDITISNQEFNYICEIFRQLTYVNSDQIYENVVISGGDTSYTIDKKNVYMCLHNYFNDSNVQMDILVFVFLHECAHIACRDDSHSDEFWCIFRLILEVFCKYHNRVVKHFNLCNLDLEQHPVKYCNSMKITYNPLFDSNTYMKFK